MFPIIAQIFILIDFGIEIGSATIDIIPDFVGWFMLFMFLIKACLDKQTTPVDIVLCFIELAFSAIEHISTKGYFIAAVRFLVPLLLGLYLLFRTYIVICRKKLATGRAPEEEALKRYGKNVFLSLVICTLIELGASITQLFSTLHLILYVIKLLLVIYVLWRESRIVRYRIWL